MLSLKIDPDGKEFAFGEVVAHGHYLRVPDNTRIESSALPVVKVTPHIGHQNNVTPMKKLLSPSSMEAEVSSRYA